jgi:predicted DNA binding CopG/RHH family protein
MSGKTGLGLKSVTNLKRDPKSLDTKPNELEKKTELKQTVINEDKIDNTVKKIHSVTTKLTRLSLDVSSEVYDKIKRKQLDKGFKTTREYLLELIENDLNPKD